jgi:hypothetical protein
MPQPMVVRESSICSLITQTAPIIFTALRNPLLIDREFRAPYRLSVGGQSGTQKALAGNEGLMGVWGGVSLMCIAGMIRTSVGVVGICNGLGLAGAVAHARSSTVACSLTRRRSSFPQHGDNHGPFTRTNIAFDVKDLLPSAEHRLTITHGHRKARTEYCRLQVGMAIAVVPRLLVGVVQAGWNQATQERW